jgi:hypothetical protein
VITLMGDQLPGADRGRRPVDAEIYRFDISPSSAMCLFGQVSSERRKRVMWR